jgi:uncharacterized coiled-coil protein SlyX
MVATLEELERRVLALEQAHNENTTTLKWMAGTLGEIKGVVDSHTEHLRHIEGGLKDTKASLARVEQDVKGLRRDMPGIVADALRARD